jgi:hypothetical protein
MQIRSFKDRMSIHLRIVHCRSKETQRHTIVNLSLRQTTDLYLIYVYQFFNVSVNTTFS